MAFENLGGPFPKKDIPQKTRWAVLMRANDRCECCQGQNSLTIHHLHYRTVGEESPGDLEALCWECHKQKHRDLAGQYWHDPEEMETHWFTYYEKSLGGEEKTNRGVGNSPPPTSAPRPT